MGIKCLGAKISQQFFITNACKILVLPYPIDVGNSKDPYRWPPSLEWRVQFFHGPKWADALELARLFYVRFLGSLINLATLGTSAEVLPALHKKKLIGCKMAYNLIGCNMACNLIGCNMASNLISYNIACNFIGCNMVCNLIGCNMACKLIGCNMASNLISYNIACNFIGCNMVCNLIGCNMACKLIGCNMASKTFCRY